MFTHKESAGFILDIVEDLYLYARRRLDQNSVVGAPKPLLQKIQIDIQSTINLCRRLYSLHFRKADRGLGAHMEVPARLYEGEGGMKAVIL